MKPLTKNAKEALQLLASVLVLCAVWALGMWAINRCDNYLDSCRRQLVVIEATFADGSKRVWCGAQKWVHYKTASVAVDVPDGQEIFYGTFVVKLAKACDR